MTNLDSIFKSRDITLPTKVHLVKAMVFPVVMYGCESWTAKKAECWKIDAFELWCWRRLLRVPWTARRSNQSILKEISPGISLEGMMLNLKLQYFGHLMRRVDSLKRLWCWEGLGAGGEGDYWGWDGWMASWTPWTWVWVNSGRWWWTGRPGVLQFMGLQRVGHDWATELNREYFWASLVAQMVKRRPAVWETWVQSLGQEDSLEKEMATHSSTLAWKIPWTEEPGGLQSMGSQRVRHDWATSPLPSGN